MKRAKPRKSDLPNLKELLDGLFERYHRPSYLDSDPIEFVHRYTDPWDQEAVALVAALLAYGNVRQIRASVLKFLDSVAAQNMRPSEWVRSLAHPQGVKRARAELRDLGWVHRFNRSDDLVELLRLLSQSWAKHGSLGAHFCSRLDPAARDWSRALDGLVADWRSWAGRDSDSSPGFRYFLTAPADGSCCKRWCMFLRWMGRADGAIDPGLWTRAGALGHTIADGRWLRPDQLVIPLDTHTGRISQKLGLTRRKSINWLAALEVTERLRAFDPADPIRYDFALCRVGILKESLPLR